MSIFDATQHPRGHASNRGAFSEKANSAPESSLELAAASVEEWIPYFEKWRHGGWYVSNVHYASGAIGCVARDRRDGKWRIACDRRPNETAPTFRSRDEAARAEREYAKSPEVVAHDLGKLREWVANYAARGFNSGPVINELKRRMSMAEQLLETAAAEAH